MDKRIAANLFLLSLPVAFGTYLFHEFGHWSVGEILGNDMVYTLNLVWPRSGTYINASHAVYVSMGGPAFSILQALLFFIVIERFKAVSAYPFVFFPFFQRTFSLAFGGFDKQDEARIASMLGAGTYTVAAIVLSLLFLIVWRSSHRLDFKMKDNGIMAAISTLYQLAVIESYTWFA